jgi:hypothetical protein
VRGQDVGNARAERFDDAGGLRADDQRHLAFGERHAAPAPDVDMVEGDGLDAQRHLAGTGRFRLRDIGDFELAIVEELESAHCVLPYKGSGRPLRRVRPS